MVSFNCNVCLDVIKKPKLDQHYSRCKSSFDCIDCSKTFNSPAEWKDHTSCISEAEKYQKNLYKGPKTGGPSAGARGQVHGRGRGRDSVGHIRGGRQGNGRWAYAGTGSNGTPLGSTPREFGQSPTNQDNEKVVDRALERTVVREDSHIQPVQIDQKKEKRKAANDGESANKKAKVEKDDGAATTTATEVKIRKAKKKDKVEENGIEENVAEKEDEGEAQETELKVEKTSKTRKEAKAKSKSKKKKAVEEAKEQAKKEESATMEVTTKVTKEKRAKKREKAG